MGKIPWPSGKEIVRFLEKQGFSIVRIRGSHHVMENNGLKTTVPVHGNQTLKIGTLRGILRDIEMGTDDFEDLWKNA